MVGLGQVWLASPSESKVQESFTALWLEVRLVFSGSPSSTPINSLSAWELAVLIPGCAFNEKPGGKRFVVVFFEHTNFPQSRQNVLDSTKRLAGGWTLSSLVAYGA